MRFYAIVLSIFAFTTGALGAEIKGVPAKDNRTLITIVGEIIPGDGDVFRAVVKSANDAGKFVSNVRLNSIGGNLLEGVKLAEAIQFGKISTNVGKGATCASACFLIFAAGSTKFANYTARIGVHGASDADGTETVRSGAATVSMARVAKELGVPAGIIGRMVVTPPSDMVWLSPQELQSMGTTMVGKPDQVPQDSVQARIPQQTRPGSPVDLQPSAKASTVPTWNELVEGGIAISSKQNGGKPLTVRSCQPELKTCFNGVMFTNSKDVVTFLKVTKDMNDKIISKEICEFNSTMDIRKCFNWDTTATRRDMQNSKGDWTKVADE